MHALFAAHSICEEDTEMTIRGLYEETGMLIDPHTAVGVAAAREEAAHIPMIVLSTAHPAKFPEAVKRATGRVADQPERLRLKLGQEERLDVLPNDYAAVAAFISARARAQDGGKSVGSAGAKRARTEVRA
jgi:threonine synthase